MTPGGLASRPLQTDDMAIVAIGLAGRPSGDPVPNGFHCRWFTSAAVGTPHLGYRLYRRDSQRPEYTNVWPAADPPPSWLQGTPSASTKAVYFADPQHAVEVALDCRSQVTLSAHDYYTADIVAQQVVPAGQQIVELLADRIGSLHLDGVFLVNQLRAAPVEVGSGWQEVSLDLCLPIGFDEPWRFLYPARRSASHVPTAMNSDWQSAMDRLLPNEILPPPRGLQGTAFEQLRDWIGAMLHKAVRRGWGHRPEALAALKTDMAAALPNEPTFEVTFWGILQAAALDPTLARALAFGCFLPASATQKPQDFRIVGTWNLHRDAHLGWRIDWETKGVNTQALHYMDAHTNAVFAPPAQVVAAASPNWQATRTNCALTTPGFTMNWSGNPKMVRVWVRAATPGDGARLDAFSGGVLVDRAQIPPGDTGDVVVSGPQLQQVILTGVDRVYLIEADDEPPDPTLSAITYNIALGQPALPSAPQPVTATALAGATQGTNDLRNVIEVTWSALDDPSPGTATRYLLRRYGLGTGKSPASAGAPVDLTPDGGVWRTQVSPKFIDAGVPDGWYAYEIEGVDLLGRQGPWGPPGWGANSSNVVGVFGAVRPPSPAIIDAWLLDSSDPLQPPGVRRPPKGNDGDIWVQWKWSAERAAQCPDATHFLTRLSAPEPNKLVGRVTAASQSGANWLCKTTLELPIANCLIREKLVIGAIAFSIVANTAGKNAEVTVEAFKDPAAPTGIIPPTTGRCACIVSPTSPLYVDATEASAWGSILAHVAIVPGQQDYETVLAGPLLTASPSMPIRAGAIALTAVRPVPGGRPDLESKVATWRIVAVDRSLPALPSQAPIGPTYAAYPDYWGNSHVKLSWSAQRGFLYEVYRAADAALLVANQVLARNGLAAFNIPGGRAMTDQEWASLAGHRGIETAFQRVSGPVSAQGATATFEDSVASRASNRLFWRIGVVTEDGRRPTISIGGETTPALGPPLGPVKLRDPQPPAAPVWAAVTAGDRTIALSWTPCSETDFSEFRLYRAWNRDALAELRDLQPIWKGSTSTYSDHVPAGLVDWFYRIVAVDTSGNVSPPSQIRRAQALDRSVSAPGTVLNASRIAGKVHVQFSHADPGVSCMVQRRVGNGPWLGASGWLKPGTADTEFADPNPRADLELRIKARSVHGVLNTTWPTAYVLKGLP